MTCLEEGAKVSLSGQGRRPYLSGSDLVFICRPWGALKCLAREVVWSSLCFRSVSLISMRNILEEAQDQSRENP